jgi:hypothetical protein
MTETKCIFGAPGRVKRIGCVTPAKSISELAKVIPFNETPSNITGVHAVMAEFVIDANSCINLRECARFSSKITSSFDCVIDTSSLALFELTYEAGNFDFDLAAYC